MAIMAIVVMVMRFMLVQMRPLLGVRSHAGGRLRSVESGTESPMVGKACMKVQLAVHVMLVVSWEFRHCDVGEVASKRASRVVTAGTKFKLTTNGISAAIWLWYCENYVRTAPKMTNKDSH